MIRIEVVAQNGFPTKSEPIILTSEENKMYLRPLEDEITSLETYEDLDDCKKNRRLQIYYGVLQWYLSRQKLTEDSVNDILLLLHTMNTLIFLFGYLL